jgi:hypothetical protein
MRHLLIVAKMGEYMKHLLLVPHTKRVECTGTHRTASAAEPASRDASFDAHLSAPASAPQPELRLWSVRA